MGILSGGTDVFIEGANFDISFGGIYCQFGSKIVTATLIRLG